MLSAEVGTTYSRFASIMSGLNTSSANLSSQARDYKVVADIVAMCMVIYNSILIAIAFCYAIGELIIADAEKKKYIFNGVSDILKN